VQYKLGVTVRRCQQHKAPQYLTVLRQPRTSPVDGDYALPVVTNFLCRVTNSAHLLVGPSLPRLACWRQDPRRRISAILDFRGPVMGSLKSPCTTSCRSSIDTIALNCLVFEKIAFFAFWRQTNKQTDEQMNTTDALRLLNRSRCRERRLTKTL